MNDDELITRLRALSADAWSPQAPPPLRLPEPEPAAAPARAPRRSPRLVLRPAFALAAAVLLLALGGLGGALLRGGDGGAPATGPSVALAPIGGRDTGTRARVDLPAGHRGGTVHVHVTRAKPTPPGHVEELWLMTDERRLASVGTFVVGPDGTADVTFHTAIDPHAFRYLDVSVEPTDGDPGHSAKSVLRSRRLS